MVKTRTIYDDVKSDRFYDRTKNGMGRWIDRPDRRRKAEWALCLFKIAHTPPGQRLVLQRVLQWSNNPTTIINGFYSQVKYNLSRGVSMRYTKIGWYYMIGDGPQEILLIRQRPFWSIEVGIRWQEEGEP